MNPHGICEPLRGLKAQNKASREAVKKIRWVLSIAVEHFPSVYQASPDSGTLQAYFFKVDLLPDLKAHLR